MTMTRIDLRRRHDPGVLTVATLDQLLAHLEEVRGSDLHLKPGSPPRVRVDGMLRPVDHPPLDAPEVEALVREALPPERAAELERTGEVDAGLSIAGVGRFRINVHRQRGSLAMAARRVPPGIPSLEELGLPPQLERTAEEERGLVIVTGASGSGKTTTVAALLDHINARRACHILTVEDPIEVLHADQMAMVTQREVGTDTPSYAHAVQRALRQDADVIAIGELTDAETALAALTAAEVGHLVITTMRTGGAVDTVQRLIDLFAPPHQGQVRQALGASIRAIVSQRLLERADGRGRIAAAEVLVGTSKVVDCILDPLRQADLEQVIAEGTYHGMQTLDQALEALVRDGLVGVREALAAATNPEDLRIALDQAGVTR
jgi:twitching motility protein PilT